LKTVIVTVLCCALIASIVLNLVFSKQNGELQAKNTQNLATIEQAQQDHARDQLIIEKQHEMLIKARDAFEKIKVALSQQPAATPANRRASGRPAPNPDIIEGILKLLILLK